MATIGVEETVLREIASLLGAIKDSATPGLAERITALVSSLGVVVAEVEPAPASALVQSAMSNAAGITTALGQLGEWQRTGVWMSVTEAVSLVTAFKDSTTSSIAERLATVGSVIGQIAGEAGPGVAEIVRAVEENGTSIAAIIRQMAVWQSDGTWDALREIASLAKGMNDSLSPQIVERLMELANEAIMGLRDGLDSELLAIGIRSVATLYESVTAASRDQTRITVTGLMRSLKEPEIQYGMKVILGILRRLDQIAAK